MSPRRVAAVLAAVGAAILAVVALYSVRAVIHHDRGKLLSKGLDLVPGSLLHVRNFHWTQMKGDHKQWELNAGEAAYSDDKTVLNLKKPVLTMILDDGKSFELHADHAELKLNGNHINQAHLTGGLDLNYGEVEIKTDEATFWPDRDMVQTSGAVQVHMPDLEVSGVGMEAHPRARLFALQHDVHTEIKRETVRGGTNKSS
ncbi:MAG TPA: LPS export ABC transporter periplasmic protein LptC [Candidatus Binataceae bacterium]|nr:LPS export ABC transporter periplasmic protein LptC [Candidatus Binataceae bacterium]